jgi:hypothetical protein
MIIKILTFILLICSNVALADRQAPPRSDVGISDNHKYAYVYRLNDDKSKLYFDSQVHPKISKNEFSFETYPKSGLYEIESKKLLWSIDHSYYKNDGNRFQSVVLDDGHVIVEGPWASTINQTAFSFYDNGRLLKHYTIEDICNNPSFFEQTMSHFTWRDEYEIDKKTKKLKFSSCGKENVIDITTGEITKSDIKPGKDLDENIVNAFGQYLKATDQILKPGNIGVIELYKNFDKAAKCMGIFRGYIDKRYSHLLAKIQETSLTTQMALGKLIGKNEEAEIMKIANNRAEYSLEEVCKFKLVQNEILKKIEEEDKERIRNQK